MQNPRAVHFVFFGPFKLELKARELYNNGRKILLQEQAFLILEMLVDHPGEVITREEIRQRLWPNNTVVEFDHGINAAIKKLRVALGDSADNPRYIETLPRVGYRFIAHVSSDSRPTAAIRAASDNVYSWPAETKPAGTAIAPVPSSAQVSRSRWNRIAVITLIAALTAVLVASYGLRKWLSRNHRLDLQDMQITKLTDSGTAEDVAISPDGRYVVYALRDGEKEGLWLRQVLTRRDVPILAPDTNGFHGLTFSPDGNYIYFVRSDKNDPFFKYLYSMPVLGGPARRLIADVDSPVSFSPDGRQFVYEHCIPARNDLELKIVNVAIGGERLLTTIHIASCFLFQPGLNWSPDGRTIAVPASLLSKPARWVLDTVSVANGSVRELFSSPDAIGRPVWLPGGDNLLVSHYEPRYHRAQLWTISFPGGEARRFTNDLTQYRPGLDITHDGGILAAVAATTVSNIWVAPAADPLKGYPITSTGPPMFDVVENADGKILAASGDGEFWSMNFDGSQRTSFGEIHNAGWLTPCGRFVAFLSYETGGSVLTRVDSDGGHPIKLTHGNLWSPACSPDGRFVFYVNFDQPQKIWRVPVDGGAPEQVAGIVGDQISGRLSVSPDGKFLAYPYDQYNSTSAPGWHVAVIQADGGAPIKTFDVPGGINGVSWSPKGQSLQYLLTRDGATNLWEEPLEGGEPKQITGFTSGLIFSFAWSSDHTKLLLTRGSVSSDVILLVNGRFRAAS